MVTTQAVQITFCLYILPACSTQLARQNVNTNHSLSKPNSLKGCSYSSCTFNYKTYIYTYSLIARPLLNNVDLAVTASTHARNHEFKSTLTPLHTHQTKESGQGSYSRLLDGADRVHEIQQRWTDLKNSWFTLCRAPKIVHEDPFLGSTLGGECI